MIPRPKPLYYSLCAKGREWGVCSILKAPRATDRLHWQSPEKVVSNHFQQIAERAVAVVDTRLLAQIAQFPQRSFLCFFLLQVVSSGP